MNRYRFIINIANKFKGLNLRLSPVRTKMSRTCVRLDQSVVTGGFLNTFDTVLTDCDGVLWMNENAIPGSVEVIQTLKNMGKKIIYVTNNSTKSREDYLKKCTNLGFPATLDDIFPTSYCVAVYLQAQNFSKKVYVFGSSGITKELDIAKIRYLPIGPDPMTEEMFTWIAKLELDNEVGAVVVGFDPHVSFPKLTKATSYLKDPNCLFIVANRDEQFPSIDGRLTVPGTGTFVAAVEAASNRAGISLGKPSHFMIDCIKHKHPDLDLKRCIMIGDRLDTDIKLGTTNNLKTLLVLTGINSLEDVEKRQKSPEENDQLQVPDYYLPCLGDLKKLITI